MRVIFLFLALWSSGEGYDILCMLPMPSRSHNFLAKGIVDSLLKAGHNVTWVTPFPPKSVYDDRLTIIDASPVVAMFEGYDKELVINRDKNFLSAGFTVIRGLREMGKMALSPELANVLVEKQFDAVITELIINEFDAGYAAVQQVPWIVLNPTTLMPHVQALVDDAHSVPIIPSFFTQFGEPMNFWERLATSGFYYALRFMSWWCAPANEAQYKEMFSDIAAARNVSLPPMGDALRNISMVFVNSHPSVAPPHSLAPNIIDVAGFHIDEKVPALPKDLQLLLDSSTQGFIYFSMGTIVQSKNFAEETRRKVLEMFSKLPYTVLWKFEDDMTDLPKNVHVRKWMPQSSILAHKNIKVFITHGGMLSNLEAITFGVPLVVIPMLADQSANAHRATLMGYAVKVAFAAETLADDIKKSLDEILGCDKYYKRAKELSSLFRDRPVSPSKLISHYVELAIRTKGAYHLRSKSPLYAWYQRAMLDQAAFLVAVLVALYFMLKILLTLVLSNVVFRSKKVKCD